MPLPDHISAQPNDLHSLMEGLIEPERGPSRRLDAVIAAAVIAFGFVCIHPFEDGNGRIHRYLIHHLLACDGFTPPGLVFPVSAAILERIDAYRATLESYSKRLLPAIEWRPTPAFNVDVLNDTSDCYGFFDATPHAAFLYAAPAPCDSRRCHDRFANRIAPHTRDTTLSEATDPRRSR